MCITLWQKTGNTVHSYSYDPAAVAAAGELLVVVETLAVNIGIRFFCETQTSKFTKIYMGGGG